MSKGVGTVISSIIMIILILGLAAFFFWLVINLDQKQVEINLREAEVLRTANTFYLTNRSLDMTWFISTVQVIFDAGETALGVTYWFNKDVKGVVSLYEPGLVNLTAYLNETMKSSYTDTVEGSSNLSNYVSITISDTAPVFEYITNADPSDPDIIISNISEDLQVSYIDTTSRNRLGHRFEIPSFFEAMLRAGNVFVESINHQNTGIYSYMDTDTQAIYEARITVALDNIFKSITLDRGIVLKESGVKRYYYFVPNNVEGSSEYNGMNIGGIRDQGGLVLNYVPYCTFAESNDGFYYHDEAHNVFTKRPFFLTVRANDTVAMLNCPAQINGQRFTFRGTNDMICYQSSPPERDDTYPELYTCNLGLVGQVTENKLRTGNCLNSQMDCSSGGFRDCNTIDCPNFCGFDAVNDEYVYYHDAQKICDPGKGGCYCNYVQTGCPPDNNGCTQDCVASQGGCVYTPLCVGSPCYPCSCTSTGKWTYGCSCSAVVCDDGCSCDPTTGGCICPPSDENEGTV